MKQKSVFIFIKFIDNTICYKQTRLQLSTENLSFYNHYAYPATSTYFPSKFLIFSTNCLASRSSTKSYSLFPRRKDNDLNVLFAEPGFDYVFIYFIYTQLASISCNALCYLLRVFLSSLSIHELLFGLDVNNNLYQERIF